MSDLASSITGPLLVATQLNWALLGTLTLQVYNFHASFPKERIAIKALVLATGWGDPEVFARLPWTINATPVITGLVSATVQIFFAWRIHALKKDSRYTLAICGLITTTALLQSSASITIGIKNALLGNSPANSDVRTLFILGKIWLLGSVVCDIIIAATMTRILLQYRTITTIFAILELGLFVLSEAVYFPGIPLLFMLGKVYSNAMMASLNARVRLDSSHVDGSLPAFSSELRFVDTAGSQELNRTRVTNVTKLQDTIRDSNSK
ncbi:hypothetical protein DFH07DRAFT_1062073 [Mycena maculata]|uniref:DUF6534 domain-containing protein n=1 Tax=Mycena maculata TaxID=230809 RepID=A0AAD7IVN4_9AGAR|nr:hypothetical protein DFH07DRAFT_1062073 [Mycena maculata]